MIINATLLVQIINFGITYLLLTRIILYPAARLLQREDAVHEKILHDIAILQQRKEDYIAFRDQQWQGCVSALAARKPSGPYVVPYTTYTLVEQEEVAADVDKELTTQLRDMIVEKAQK